MGVPRNIKECLEGLQGCFKRVSWVLQRSSKGVSMKFYWFETTGSLGVFQECFKEIVLVSSSSEVFWVK